MCLWLGQGLADQNMTFKGDWMQPNASTVSETPACNFCGSDDLRTFRGRPACRCAQCMSLERTRIAKLVLDGHRLRPGQRVLHLAPERALSKYLQAAVGPEHYDAIDIDPSRYPWLNVRRVDLVTDAEKLPTEAYDLVLHSHVIEHIPCNITAVLYHLHRSLTNDGLHLFAMPIDGGRRYSETLAPLEREQALSEYGHPEHVRRFCRADLDRTLGMIFDFPEMPDLEARFGASVLRAAAIPERLWRGWNGSVYFEMRKRDIKLR